MSQEVLIQQQATRQLIYYEGAKRDMQRYILRRLIWATVSVIAVLSVVFVMLRLTGDPAVMLLSPQATGKDYENIRRSLGLDRPLPEQYVRYVWGLLRGDFGDSFQYRVPAAGVILQRLPNTLMLTGVASLLMAGLGVLLGMLSAATQNSPLDGLITSVTLLGQSIPNFWLGIMLIAVFSVQLGWFPTSGSGTLAHLVLPAITLALQPISKITRLTRSEFIEALAQDYVRTAKSKGLARHTVHVKHALRNASLGIVTMIGLDVGYLLGGAIITETVFAWPGIGRLVVEAISHRDFPVVQGVVVLIALLVVGVNTLVDVLYGVLDPRVRYA